uniref:Uncharacterized protein n=1 Tax=Anopheles culicifacies TaxID=139723 RepID=A0A182M6U9_9DIPT
MADLQAYVYLKSLQQLSEAELTSLSQKVMSELVSTGIAYNQNGYYRLNELLRSANDSSSKQAETIEPRDLELSSGSGLKKTVNFSNTVTMWPIDAMDGVSTIAGTVSNPAPHIQQSGPISILDQEDIESPEKKLDPGNKSDSDNDGDDDNKPETNTSAFKADPETESDSDLNLTDHDEDKEPPDSEKQEPDNEPTSPDTEGNKENEE